MDQNIRWFAIAADNTFNEYIDFNEEIHCSFWIKRTDTGNRHTTMYNNTFEIYNYDFYDTELKPFKLTICGWQLHSCNNYEYKNVIHNLSVEIADPNGQVREFKETEREVKGILKNIDMLKMLSKFKDWRDFDNFDQIRILQEKNKALQSKIDSLQSVMIDFTKSDFFKQLLFEIKDMKDSQEKKNFFVSKGLPKHFYFDWISSQRKF